MKKKPHSLTRAQVANVKKWIAALRSGKYKQTRFLLHNTTTGGYCCLGVAADVLNNLDPKIGCDNSNSATLSPKSVKRLGLQESNGALDRDLSLEHPLSLSTLTAMNDASNPATFKQIAKLIEEQLETNSRNLFIKE